MQINKGETFVDSVDPGDILDATRLNNHVAGATLLNGAILDQVEKVITIGADVVLLGDSTLTAADIPKKVQLTNLLPETVRQGVQQYGTESAGTDAYVVTLAPLPTGLTTGMVVRFKATTANTGGATLSLVTAGSPTTAKAILTPAQRVLQTGDILAGQMCECVYDGAQFILTSARSLRLGIEQFGTGGGTANAQTVTLSPTATTLTAGMTVRFVASVTNTGACTLTVDALAATAIKKIVAGAAVALVANDIQTGDVITATYDGTQFQIADRVRSWDYVSTAGATLAAGLTTFAHGLGATPTKVNVVLINTTNQAPWVVNDELNLDAITRNDGGQRVSWWANATNVVVALYNNSELYACAASATLTNLTAADWKIKVYASL